MLQLPAQNFRKLCVSNDISIGGTAPTLQQKHCIYSKKQNRIVKHFVRIKNNL